MGKKKLVKILPDLGKIWERKVGEDWEKKLVKIPIVSDLGENLNF